MSKNTHDNNKSWLSFAVVCETIAWVRDALLYNPLKEIWNLKNKAKSTLTDYFQ